MLIGSIDVNEFAVIDTIASALGDSATAPWIRVGIGDDAAVMRARDGFDQVASIDTLVADVHFPTNAPPELIGYRALMVSLSDLAAMAAVPRYALVALTLPEVRGATCQQWVQRLASGMAVAAQQTNTALCGGNLSRGPLAISVSVHGEVEAGQARLRSTAAAGERVYVSGPLGSAAACVRTNQLLPVTADALTAQQHAYYRPAARFDCRADILAATSAIDISDGLLQDLAHVLEASGCGAELHAHDIPLGPGAELADALAGGDDYQLLFSSARPPATGICIGKLTHEPGIRLDGKDIPADGYQHFSA
ncbi:MAG: thiamine-phosphate kinase [Pseudomonadota bacterium]|nr:thiamine-phosphate kinase [Pseudomonadota bacterium]